MGGGFLKSLSFGAVIAASIGPIALLIIGTAANRGLWPGCFAGLGAALADLAYALIAFSIGAMLLPLLVPWMAAIRVGSALVLVVMAIAMLRRDFAASDEGTAAPRHPAGSLLPTFALTMVNPMTLVLFAGFAAQLPLAGSIRTAGWLAFGLFCGSLLVQLALAAAGALVGATLQGRCWQRIVNLAGAAGIFVFGVVGLLAAG